MEATTTQHANAHGSYIHITQIQGDGNTVVQGEHALQLRTLEHVRPKGKPQSPAAFLQSQRCSIPCEGREPQFDLLFDWLHAPAPPLSVRTFTGRGGSGKTRLALELLDRLEKQNGEDGKIPWQAGFLDAEDLAFLVSHHAAAGWHWTCPTLIVVDYAASLGPNLAKWLKALAYNDTPEDAPSLRILLLERHADLESGWYKKLANSTELTGSEIRLLELFDQPHPEPLPPLEDRTIQRRILEKTLTEWQAVSGEDVPEVPSEGLEEGLAKKDLADPLPLMMAAFAAMDCGFGPALALSRIDLAKDLAAREHQLLRRFSEEPLFMLGAACITACKALPRKTVVILIEEACKWPGLRGNHPSATTTAAALADAFPLKGETKTRLTATWPDIIAEAFTLRLLRDPLFENNAQNTIQTMATHAPGETMDFLFRAVQDFAHIGLTQEEGRDERPIQWFTALIQHAIDTSQITLLQHAERALSETSISLTHLRVEILQALLEHLEGTPENSPERARLLNNLTNSLSGLGKHEEALDAAQQACTIREALASERPDAFRPDWATSLNNLASRLRELGKLEDALDAVQKGCGIYETLAHERPDAFRHHWAMSLNNLAAVLSELGKREAALDAAQRACALCEAVACERPDAFRHHWAMSLNNLAAVLSELGKRKAALDTAQQACDLYEALSRERPDAFRHLWATSLNNLAVNLGDMGKREKALDAARQACMIREALASEQPDAFQPKWAMSLINLANSLSDLGKREEALDVAQQACDLYEVLASEQPDAFRPDWAMSLNNLGTMLSDMGNPEEALDAAQQANNLYEILATEWPDAFLPECAMSFNNLGTMLSEQGGHEEALEMAQKACALYEALACERPDVFTPDCAMSLDNLGNRLSDVGKREEALEAAQKACALYEALSRERPDAFRHYWAMSLNNLGNRLREVGKHEEALETAQQSCAIREALARERPDAFTPDLAVTLGTLSLVYRSMQQHAAAAESALRGVRVVLPALARYPQAHAELTAALCREYMQSAEAAGLDLERDVLEEVGRILEPLRAAAETAAD
jgi:tetratricopeptide (TPR) repeat protein